MPSGRRPLQSAARMHRCPRRPGTSEPSLVWADAIAPELIAARARFYLCGPPAMRREVTRGLIVLGVPKFEIFSESFVSTPTPRPPSFPISATRFGSTGPARRLHGAPPTARCSISANATGSSSQAAVASGSARVARWSFLPETSAMSPRSATPNPVFV